MLAHRGGERHSQGAGATADLEHALTAGYTQAGQQQRSAFLIAPLPEPWGGNPARSGDRIPIETLRGVRFEGFRGHVPRSFRLCRCRKGSCSLASVTIKDAPGRREAGNMSATITAIYRYPIKGLSAEKMD